MTAFVEVKTRTAEGCGTPLESITWRKRREVEKTALEWLLRFDERGKQSPILRFDAVSVVLRAGRLPSIEHVEGAWSFGE